MTAKFELNGQEVVALNGGPIFKFNEAVSFVVNCDTQEEIDYFWETLSDGGEKSRECLPRAGGSGDKRRVSVHDGRPGKGLRPGRSRREAPVEPCGHGRVEGFRRRRHGAPVMVARGRAMRALFVMIAPWRCSTLSCVTAQPSGPIPT